MIERLGRGASPRLSAMRLRPRPLVAAIGAACFAIFAVVAGQDVNWDKQNYHLYDAVALLAWRYDRDVVPAGPQTTLNPMPYLIPYVLDRGCGPSMGAVLLSALQSVSVVFA